MASTRNNNTPGNYCLQQRSYAESRNYTGYTGAAVSNETALPCLGVVPSHMAPGLLSYNPVDIESSLRGTGSVNLVHPQAPVKPELKQLPSVAFFKTVPVVMPAPMVIENNQRPFPI